MPAGADYVAAVKRRSLPSSVALGALSLALFAGCGTPPRPARTSAAEPERPRERAARERYEHRRCSPYWGFLFPGLGQLCLHQDAEGGTLMGVTGLDVAGLVAGAAADKPSAILLGSTGIMDAYLVGGFTPVLQRQLAAHKRFVPEDTLDELLFAPFNGRVLARPEVWGGVLGQTAVGLLLSFALLDRGSTPHPSAAPRLFGQDVPRGLAYPAAGLTYGATFSQVAIAEETVFRGVIQSGLARSCGEGCGWALSSFAFGLFHGTNAIGISDPKERLRYLAIGLPYLVLSGQFLGGVYWMNRYSLAAPVAIHFWYDFLLSTVYYAMDPRHANISARVGFPF